MTSKKGLKWTAIGAVALVLGYLISVTIVDAHLMGTATPYYSGKLNLDKFLIEDSARIDFQTGYKCSAYSSAYLMRHWGIEAQGDSLYDIMPHKMQDGYVYPKGIIALLENNHFSVGYHIGNITALKNEIAKGHPVIVMIKIRPDRDWLHYVPVVGYSTDSLFFAESIPELSNTQGKGYNRSISTKDFETLWNTQAFKMPLYVNTFITASKRNADSFNTNRNTDD